MMNRIRKITFALGPMLFSFLGCGQESKTIPAASHLPVDGPLTLMQKDSIEKYIPVFPDNTQLAFAFLKGDSVVFCGVQRLNDTLILVENRDSVFEIGSISKVFTATLLAQAALDSLVALDEPIAGALEFPLQPSEPGGRLITYRMLANHTSGLPRIPKNMFWAAITNPDNPYVDYDRAKLEEYLREKLKLESDPGEKYAYSNLGAGLLAYLLEQKTGKNYETMLRERIFGPLGMKASTTERAKITERLVSGRGPKGEIVPNWDLNALAGAGAILSTAADLSRFARANFGDDPALRLQREKTFSISNSMDIALGWHLIKTKEGRTWPWHNGGTGGYSSSMAIDPDTRTSVIILSNITASHPQRANLDQLCFALMKTL